MIGYIKNIIEEIKLLKIKAFEIKNKLENKSTILEVQKKIIESIRHKEKIQFGEVVKWLFDEKIRTSVMPEILKREEKYQRQLEETIKRSKDKTPTNKLKEKTDIKQKGIKIDEPE